ncbi:MAG TPA: sugar phosphate nucleotidyltransferase [Candidatus Saccharimonadia bacterium]|jgi:mannose-1-phosphate guanylyltransferase
MKIIVVAGGQGTKLWPYSRESKPKQFQPILGDKSPFTYNIETLLRKFAPEDIFVSTKRKFIKYVSEQAPQIPLRNYIIEPDVKKDRGPAEGLAVLQLSLHHPDEPFMIVQSDNVRQPEEEFLQFIEDAGKIVEREKKYVTGGIKATEPDMGVDYLKLSEKVQHESNQEIYSVDEFIGRKSTFSETKKLVESFHVVVHCNHTCWYPKMFLDAYKQHRPDWYEALMEMKQAIGKPGEDAEIERIYSEMAVGPTEEVTRHVMGKGIIILTKFKWIDFGTWGSLYEFFSNGGSNYADGNVVTVDATESLIKTSNKDKLIAVAGIENLVVVDTDDVLLVIPKNKIEKIKDIQKLLATDANKSYL